MRDDIMRGVVALKNPAIWLIVVSVVFYIIITISIQHLDVKSNRFNMARLFVGLEGLSFFHLAFAWMKFALFTILLLLAKPVEIYLYLLIFCFCIGTIATHFKIKDLLIELISSVLCIGGLWIGTTLIDYLNQVKSDFSISASYWMLSGVFILCALAIFVREISIVSSERKNFNENGEIE